MPEPPDDPGESSFWHELQRRKVFRVATAYLLACFVLLQVLDAAGEALGVTAAGMQILLAAMVLGFPLTVALAWLLEITPQGVMAERSSRLTRRFGRVLEIGALAGLFVIAGLIAFFILAHAMRAIGGGTRVAVLAFENFTENPANTYISDGLAEELIDGLAQLEELVVLPRTASFYYRNKDVDFATIAEALDADMVLEGSLLDRRDNRLRVAAQLINVRDRAHVWSQIYDRELDDLIEVKQDIARNVVNALALALSPGSVSAIETPTTSAGEAYDLYLQGKDYLNRATTRQELEVARDLFARAFSLDPQFPPALAGQCRAEINLYNRSTETPDHRQALATCTRLATLADESPESRLALADLGRAAGSCDEAVAIYENIIRDAPDLEPAYYGLARCLELLGDPDDAEDAYRRSVELERRNWQVYLGYSGFLYRQGRYLESAEMSRRIVELTPDNGPAWSNLGTALFAAGAWAEAATAWRRGHELSPNQYSYVNLGTALYYQRRFQEAAEVFIEGTQAYPDNYRLWGKLGAACRNLDRPPASCDGAYQRGIELGEAALAINPDDVAVLGPLGTYYANVGRFPEAEQTLAHAVSLSPQDPELRFFQALVARLQEQPERARDLLAQAVALGYSRRIMTQEPLTETLASGL